MRSRARLRFRRTAARAAALATAALLLGAGAAPAQTPLGSRDLTVMTYNIASALETGNELGPIAAYIRAVNPDVVALQEVDMSWSRSDSFDQAGELAQRLGMRAIFDANLDCVRFDLDDDGSCAYGTAILTRFPVLDSETRFYGLPRYAGREPRGLARVVLDVNGRPFEVFNTHLSFYAPERRAQVNAVHRLTAYRRVPRAVMGDFNVVPASAELAPMRRSFIDAQAARRLGARGTTNALRPLRLDYVWLSRGIYPLSVRLLYARLSDHRPVIARIRLPFTPAYRIAGG